MAGRGRLAGAGVILAGVLAGAPAAGADDVTVTVHVENHAHVPPSDWDIVLRAVEDIYRSAGITLTWAGPLRVPMSEVPRDGVRRLALVLVNIREPFAGSARDTADVLGRAAPDIARTWVFANRVADVANTGPIDANLLLARVVAHELGHLLLPSEPHASSGIMRAGIELNQAGFYGFTEEQASLIREGIRRHVRF